jgi:hypothetical protein
MLNTYTTEDFYLAAYLMAAGFKLHSHTRLNGKTSFVFLSTDEIRSALENYYTQNAKDVDALSYASSVRALKSVVHSYDTNSNSKGNQYVKQYKGIR